MAVVKIPQASKLAIKVQTGVNAAGNPVYKVRSLQNLKPAAADSDVYAIGEGLAGLQKDPVSSVARVDESNLINE